MGLTGKLIMYLEISSHGDMLHDVIRHRPNDMASISPGKVHACDILDGQPGAVGSILCWDYTQEDGKKQSLKQIIEEIDETNKKIVLKVIEGDLMEECYKFFKMVFHVEPKGDGQLVVWTFEFEKMNTSVSYPTVFMDYILDRIRDMDIYNINNQ